MGLFKKRSTDPEEMKRLKAEIAAMSERLSASDQAEDELRQTVQGLKTRIETPIAPPPTEPPPVAIDRAQLDMMNAKIERLGSQAEPTIDPRRLDELTASLGQLSTRVDGVEQAPTGDTPSAIDPAQLDDLQETMQRITDRIDELDGRITSISTELANQITEISGELDGLGADEPATDETVAELRDAQTRLATEQARYQIAFRQDLAELAARLKRA